jgi:hypothetical protein
LLFFTVERKEVGTGRSPKGDSILKALLSLCGSFMAAHPTVYSGIPKAQRIKDAIAGCAIKILSFPSHLL